MLQPFKMARFSLILSLLLVLGFAGCKSEDPYQQYANRQREADDAFIQKYLADNKITNFTKSTTGLYYLPGQPGSGDKAQKGNTITMHYIGRYLVNGQKMESTYDSGIPSTFVVGAGRLAGLNEGATLMNKGEKATLILPSHLAYGTDVIMYEITVLDIK
ncbi:FKBP-type peptidyl-prolyl cis-trans isomerase [Adhaeribacter swui]|uniref:Peptidyl-prolyl cis-trans isomerase n=1 Tax=Adhaeribacter swui TaxID=2086471 RepID=A0A7G7G709_9BACT|nr:FKBP-type peptidyl-prolyl cis-trans isomerase [Adhaeribacter swui]QNF32943.1 FKBP-type peptidyl-prolyl cis-trans isomerase [Adhaeribacter swui]